MTVPSSQLFSAMFEAMRDALGPSEWWPAQSAFEVAVGAILTQNTNWANVQKAIANLQDQDLLHPVRMLQVPERVLEDCIRPSGFFRQKTRKLHSFLEFLGQERALDFAARDVQDTRTLRRKLLAVRGIGPETADSILLYALHRPVFVVDAYTARICNRHELVPEDVTYEELQTMFMQYVPEDVVLYNEYHALLVRIGKEWSRKREARCPACPLRSFLPRPGR